MNNNSNFAALLLLLLFVKVHDGHEKKTWIHLNEMSGVNNEIPFLYIFPCVNMFVNFRLIFLLFCSSSSRPFFFIRFFSGL